MPSFTWQSASCKKILTYKLENHSPDSSLSALPNFLNFDSSKGTITLSGTNFKESGVSYNFKYIATTEDKLQAEFNFSVQTTFKNSSPIFKESITQKVIEVTQNYEWTLPEIVDPDLDIISSINVKLGPSQSWLKFDSSSLKFSSDKDLISNNEAG